MTTSLNNILFRFDAGTHIGGGHMVRCLAFADALAEEGYKCNFLCNEEAWDFPALQNSKHKKITEEELNKYNFLYGIIDHYGLDENYEKTLKPYCKKLLVIDDLANRKHACDMLVDFSPARKKLDYIGLVPKHCEIFTGIEYLIMRKEFFINKKPASPPSLVKSIFITMGSIDGKEKLPEILQYLVMHKEALDINVLLTHKTKTIEDVKNIVKSTHHNMRLHIDISTPVDIMLQSDLAISAGGMTCLELVMLQIPTLAFVVADNQVENVNYLNQHAYIKLLENISEIAKINFNKFLYTNKFNKLNIGKNIKIIDKMF